MHSYAKRMSHLWGFTDESVKMIYRSSLSNLLLTLSYRSVWEPCQNDYPVIKWAVRVRCVTSPKPSSPTFPWMVQSHVSENHCPWPLHFLSLFMLYKRFTAFLIDLRSAYKYSYFIIHRISCNTCTSVTVQLLNGNMIHNRSSQEFNAPLL